jgi:hypothetical protein
VPQFRAKRKVEIVDLESIKKEYQVALAKLSLVKENASNSAASGNQAKYLLVFSSSKTSGHTLFCPVLLVFSTFPAINSNLLN